MEAVQTNTRTYNRTLVVVVMMIAMAAGALMQTSLGTAIPSLMKAFDINLSTAQQATTWFLLFNGMMVPLSAYLANRIPTKILHMVAYGLLFIGVLVTMSTPENSGSWWIFIVGRIISAMAFGIMMPMMQIVILNMYAPEERGAAMGAMGLVIGMVPAIGPTLSGWILKQDHTILGFTLSDSWRSTFLIPLIITGIALVLTPFLMKNVIPTKKVKLDFLSLVLSTIGFGLFLWGFTNVGSHGWGNVPTVLVPIFAGVALLVVFVWRQLKLSNPFLDVKVFLTKDFTIPSVVGILAMMAMFGVEMMLPTYLQNVRGLSAFDSGLTLLWGALLMGVFSAISGALYNKVGARALGMVGFAILGLGTFPFLFLTPETPTIIISVLYGVRMAGIAMAMMPMTTKAMAALPDAKTSHGTAANNTLRQVANSVVVALLTSVVQNVINNNTPSNHLKVTEPLRYASKMLDASLDGFKIAFMISLGFAVLGFILAFFVKQDKKEEA